MTRKEKFLQIVSKEETSTLAKAKERQQKRAFTRLSQQIALAILERLDAINWSQKRLADAMGVSPQYILGMTDELEAERFPATAA